MIALLGIGFWLLACVLMSPLILWAIARGLFRTVDEAERRSG